MWIYLAYVQIVIGVWTDNVCVLICRIQAVESNKFLVVLELDDVIETDAGLYKVKAKNKMGEVAASINLNFSR